MTSRTAVENPDIRRSQCWCCNSVDDPDRMVHLGSHPEVALCLRCAHWASKQAWEIEDCAKTGRRAMARDRLRAVRRGVIKRGWQHSPLVGGPLRWIGKRMP